MFLVDQTDTILTRSDKPEDRMDPDLPEGARGLFNAVFLCYYTDTDKKPVRRRQTETEE